MRDIRNDIVDRLEKEKDDDGYSLLSKTAQKIANFISDILGA